MVTLRKSKTDQEGPGRKIGIPYGSKPATCPARALTRWLEVSRITEGPLFRPINRHSQIQPARLSDKAVALVVKRHAEAAGRDPSRYAGHSLRAGLATAWLPGLRLGESQAPTLLFTEEGYMEVGQQTYDA